MNRFKPRLDVLPEAQRRLWPQLAQTARLGFVLYGGTAIALRLGHRPSVDFDFFTDQRLDRDALYAALPLANNATVLQDRSDTLTLLVEQPGKQELGVKLSFFGGISFGRIGEPELTDDGVLQAASLDDLLATKLKVILQRAEARDYRDIAALLGAGVSLARALAGARLMFSPTFQPSEGLKALVYFEDGDLRTLSREDRKTLVRAAGAIRALPSVELRARELAIAGA